MPHPRIKIEEIYLDSDKLSEINKSSLLRMFYAFHLSTFLQDERKKEVKVIT